MDATQLFIPRVTRPSGVETALELMSSGIEEASPFVEMLRPAVSRPAEPPRQPVLPESQSAPPAGPSEQDYSPPAQQDSPRAREDYAASEEPPKAAPTAEANPTDERAMPEDQDENSDPTAEALAVAAQVTLPAPVPDKTVMLAPAGAQQDAEAELEAVDKVLASAQDVEAAPAKLQVEKVGTQVLDADGNAMVGQAELLPISGQVSTVASVSEPTAVSEVIVATDGRQQIATDEQPKKSTKKKGVTEAVDATAPAKSTTAHDASQPVAAQPSNTAAPVAAEQPVAEASREQTETPSQSEREDPTKVALDQPQDVTPASADASLTPTAEALPLPDQVSPVGAASAPQPLHETAAASRADASSAINSNSPGSRLPNWLRGPSETAPERRPVVVDSMRFLQRVTRAFEAAQSRGGDVKLRLSPPELGAVHIELRVQDGVLSARLETENSAAKAVLLENLPALKERLADQGMRIENFEVNVGSRNPGGTPDRPQDRSDQPRSEAPRSLRDPERRVSGAEQAVRPRTWTGDGALNVIV